MLFTDKFVYVHEPKTGGTFVKEALYRIHVPNQDLPRPRSHKPNFQQELNRPRLSQLTKLGKRVKRILSTGEPEKIGADHTYTSKYGKLTFWEGGDHKHASCSDIPTANQHKPILATVRNPYELYLSEYKFGWWKKAQYQDLYRKLWNSEIPYPNYPNLTFAEYVELIHQLRAVDPEMRISLTTPEERRKVNVGPFSERFVRYFCRDPWEVIRKLHNLSSVDGYIKNEEYRENLFDIYFIKTSRLASELYSFLLDMNYDEDDIRFILELKKIRPQLPPEGTPRNDNRHWTDHYTPELKRIVRQRERLLFSLFPEFDV